VHLLVPIIPANILYLKPDVQVAVDGQYRVLEVMNGLREEFVRRMLKELLQEELRRGCQQCMLAVRSTDVLKRHYWCQALRNLQLNQGEPLLTLLTRSISPAGVPRAGEGITMTGQEDRQSWGEESKIPTPF